MAIHDSRVEGEKLPPFEGHKHSTTVHDALEDMIEQQAVRTRNTRSEQATGLETTIQELQTVATELTHLVEHDLALTTATVEFLIHSIEFVNKQCVDARYQLGKLVIEKITKDLKKARLDG